MIGNYSFFILFSVFLLPKINLIPLTAGTYLKLDDVIIFGFVLLVFLDHSKKYNIKTINLIFPFFVLICIFLVSTFLNVLSGNVHFLESLAFAIRPLEYFAYFFVGTRISIAENDLIKFLKISVLLYGLLVPLQYYGILSVYSEFSPDRAMAFTAGPYEFAMMAAFLTIYFYNKNVGFGYVALSFLLLLSTQSRITTVAVLLVISGRWFKLTWRHTMGWLTLFVLIVFTLNFIEIDKFGRFTELFSMDGTFLSDYLDKIPKIHSREDYFTYGYEMLLESDFGEGDASFLIRIYRWTILLNYMLDSPLTMMFGLGPSFASVALDGYYIRLLVESGVIGLIVFTYFIRKALRVYSGDVIFFQYVYVMLVTALFIDIFVSSRAMFVFWFLAGYYKKTKNITGNKSVDLIGKCRFT